MAEAFATVYDPPSPGQPYVAIIMMGGKAIFAEAVDSVQHGNDMLRQMLHSLAELAEKGGPK